MIKKLKTKGWVFRQDLQNEAKQISEEAIEENFLKTFKHFVTKNNLSGSFNFNQQVKSRLLKRLKDFEFWDVNKPISFSLESGREIEIPLINKEDVNKNIFEVVQQVRECRKDKFQHIYDLVLLINGLPFVCIELKNAKRGDREGFE